MTKNTTDELRQEIEFRLQMADIDVVPVEAINSIIDLISNREKLARIDEWEKFIALESGENGRLATLRKELDGGQSDET